MFTMALLTILQGYKVRSMFSAQRTTTDTAPHSSFARYSRSYSTPLSMSTMHSLGFLLAIALHLFTGLLLAMQYFPDFALGYTSVRTLTLDTILGYFMQPLHANNASLVMLLLYAHMLRTLHYSHTSHRLATIGFTLATILTATCSMLLLLIDAST